MHSPRGSSSMAVDGQATKFNFNKNNYHKPSKEIDEDEDDELMLNELNEDTMKGCLKQISGNYSE